MRRFLFAAVTLLALSGTALADARGTGGRGFDPSGPDAEMLRAAAKAGQLVNTNQATVEFQTWWYEAGGADRPLAEFQAWRAKR